MSAPLIGATLSQDRAAMKMDVSSQDVERRLQQVQDELNQLKSRTARLLALKSDLQVTLTTLEQLRNPDAAAADLADIRKPVDAPTVPEMILIVLAERKDGAEPKEVMAAIRERWWPDAPGGSIGPVLWRMQKDDRVQKTGKRYHAVQPPQTELN